MNDSASLNLTIAPGGGDLVPLLIWARADEVLAVQARIAEFLAAPASGEGAGGTYKPPFQSTYGPKDAWDLPAWKGDEQEAARWILSVVGENQRRVLAHLVGAGRGGVWTGQLRHAAGYDDSKSMSGVFKAIGGRFRSVGLRPLWNGGVKDANKGQRLSVLDDNVQLLFASLIRSNYPALAAEFNITETTGV